MKRLLFAISIVLASALAGCGAATGATPALLGASSSLQRVAAFPTSYTTRYVQLVIFENESYQEVVGNPQAPYITSLAADWANMTDSHAITHPSQPNYLALFSGSTQGVTSDNCPVTFTAASLGSQLIKAKVSYAAYAESMPSVGYEGCQADPDSLPSGYLYMRKHVPWADFSKIPGKYSLVYKKAFSKPPARFIWITPNMCNDMHDCSIATGDTWASKNLKKLIAWDTANDGVLILTFDENGGTAGNQITTILAGNVIPGQYSQNITHYSVLRTIEDIFGVKPLANAATASPIAGVIK